MIIALSIILYLVVGFVSVKAMTPAITRKFTLGEGDQYFVETNVPCSSYIHKKHNIGDYRDCDYRYHDIYKVLKEGEHIVKRDEIFSYLIYMQFLWFIMLPVMGWSDIANAGIDKYDPEIAVKKEKALQADIKRLEKELEMKND